MMTAHSGRVVLQYALAALPLILKQQKRHKTKDKINPFVAARSETEFGNAAVVPGDRPDNAWLQYRRQTVPDTEDAWNNCIFVDKTHWGYYCWPRYSISCRYSFCNILLFIMYVCVI